MDGHHYANLTVINDSEIQSISAHIEERAVIARLPQSARDIIGHKDLKDVIQEELQINIKVEDISQYNSDYIIMLDSSSTKTILLDRGFLKVGSFILPLIPWDRSYGSTILPLQTHLTDAHNLNPHSLIASNSQHLTIYIYGLPPHLCCEFIVRQLLKKICIVHKIAFTPANLTYSVDAYGSDMSIPEITHIGVKKETHNGSIISIWPLWYEVITEDMHPNQHDLYYLENTDNFRGDSDLDSEHHKEVQKQYYDLQDGNKETTSQLNEYIAGYSDDSDWEPYVP
ncbi:hypothetical protein BDA96_09G169700 [Sorghum bicolor]|uniref:Uncharacterized protein n=1 Tax=Sorghum bicolor TaxID=4558 RepID=A0A921QDH4_SORBI|nr:uncharacterized protein LOC110430338 isoform X1 [Sorghum bicolor]XP_021303584.1 uncharacterized protein LOC110430338 isoform X1 [Sorghum bicolor]XP_021303585.1 uncharacterized protein LOC110430338 isoform X1 [Sorghum bicolor]XP_021303586.1 uncharacterized protein LOC110430338 isoform X1 [Sorghum bicolor]KAG0518370.1 hypothetical protein BDA96_09G169700 [Sorghum bicolor]|eukprot:XP_021303583.1 uncharacterized protein LOC110430338 isoform X1 [Sorghum bicolor]